MIKYKKILLVDDDTDDRLIFEEILREMDDDFLNMIILDQNMPKMTGRESLVFLKESPRYQAIPAIIYSTYQGKDFYREMIEQFLVTR